jgi:uncharacterized YccA/Bax inhibitor family protein
MKVVFRIVKILAALAGALVLTLGSVLWVTFSGGRRGDQARQAGAGSTTLHG